MRSVPACLLLIGVLWIPALSADAHDDAALQELLRGSDGIVKHWNSAPELVVLESVMMYRSGEAQSYTATSERLTGEEADELVSDLTAALGLLTGNTYTRFAVIHRESVPAGTEARVLRSGQIVAGSTETFKISRTRSGSAEERLALTGPSPAPPSFWTTISTG